VLQESDGVPRRIKEYYLFTPEEFKTFCAQLCKEQLEIAANNARIKRIETKFSFGGGRRVDYVLNKESILNVPMPEI
jgi:hypothetical protein